MNSRRPRPSFSLPSPYDVIARLNLDAGTRILGERIQERQLALSEILRLGAVVNERTGNHPTRNVQHRASAA